MDFLLNPQGLWLLEVNPRIPASHWIYDRGNGGLSVTAHLEGCQGRCQALENRMTAYSIPKQPALQCVLYARQSGTVFSQWNDLRQLPAGVRLADIPQANVVFIAGTPMLSLLAESTSVDGLCGRIGQLPDDPSGKFVGPWKIIAEQVRKFHAQWQQLSTEF